MNEYIIAQLESGQENMFHDLVVELVKEDKGLSITQIKQELLDDILNTEEISHGDIITSEISGGLTKSGNPENVGFYVKHMKVETKGNIDILNITITI